MKTTVTLATYGITMTCKGLATLDILIRAIHFPITVTVLHKLGHDLILGYAWLRYHFGVLDFDRGSKTHISSGPMKGKTDMIWLVFHQHQALSLAVSPRYRRKTPNPHNRWQTSVSQPLAVHPRGYSVAHIPTLLTGRITYLPDI